MTSNKNSINISFLNLAAQSPSLELNFAMSEKIHIDSNRDKHIFFMCDKALKSCSVNILNKQSICRICTAKAKKGFKIFKKRNRNSELIKLTRGDLVKNSQKPIENKEIKDELMLGVHSTIGSQLRLDDMKLLDDRWKLIKEKMYESSKGLFNYFDTFLQDNNVSNFIIFNGRLSCARPLISVSKKHNTTFNLFDASVNGKVPMYAANEMFHSISFEKKNALRTYVNYFNESEILAAKYMNHKRNGIAVSDHAYTKDQKKGHIDVEILELSKPLISIFVSSDDEFRFIGSDWADFKFVDQIETIKKLINSNLSDKYDFVVKMHPNQKNMHESIQKRYEELSNSVNVLFPDNKTDTYELILHSELILNFCSTVGAEANYLRKPVVQIGPSRFRLLPCANYVDNVYDAIKMIKQKKYKLMPKRASVVYFCYHAMTPFKLDSYKFIDNGVYTYGDERIQTNFIVRLLAVPDKLIYHIIKGNKEIFSNFFLYARNLLFGTTKVK
jgi:hypothetical protein